jgi:hypothetical protein
MPTLDRVIEMLSEIRDEQRQFRADVTSRLERIENEQQEIKKELRSSNRLIRVLTEREAFSRTHRAQKDVLNEQYATDQ